MYYQGKRVPTDQVRTYLVTRVVVECAIVRASSDSEAIEVAKEADDWARRVPTNYEVEETNP